MFRKGKRKDIQPVAQAKNLAYILEAQMVKNLPALWETRFSSLGQEGHLGKGGGPLGTQLSGPPSL